MTQIRANITTAVNSASIRRETRNGRAVIVVPSATLPDNVVMNRIMYPADVIEAGYKTLERTPAPLGHPAVNGVYINANDPEAINGFWVGAWNENVRRENGRVKLDKVIDVQRAESTDEGKRLLEAINKQKPMHTSTGLRLTVNEVEHDDYDRVATAMIGDHDCFLLDQAGAATPEQGVGVFVNSAGEQVEVVNSELVLNEELPGSMEDMRRELNRVAEDKYGSGYVDDFNADSVIFYQMEDDKAYKVGYAVMDGEIKLSDQRQEVQRKTTWEAVTNTIRNTLSKMFGNTPGKPHEAAGLQTNSQTSTEENQMTTEELQAMLDKQAETLQANQAQAIADAVKPLQDKLDAINAEAEATAKAEKETLESTVVEAKLATEDEAKALDVNALRIMARNCKTPKSADHALNGGRLDATNSADDSKFDTLPE